MKRNIIFKTGLTLKCYNVLSIDIDLIIRFVALDMEIIKTIH